MRVHVKRVHKDLYILRVDDDKIKYFEALWSIPEGITYNSYLLTSESGAVLFDTWKGNYDRDFIEAIQEITDLNDIEYVVIHHMEEDHSGSLPTLLKATNLKPTVIGHPLTYRMIDSFFNIKPKFKAIKDGEMLDMGNYELKFIYTPWLHWPETIMTYINGDTLLSCDAFGSYSIPNAIIDEDLSTNEVLNYLRFAKKYFITVIGHYKDFVIKNIDKLTKLTGGNIRTIAPSHGLIWRRLSSDIMKAYREWAEGRPEKGKITIIYASMYGHIERLMEGVIRELSKLGVKISTYRFNDSEKADVAEILTDIVDSEVLIIGAATYEADMFPEIEYVLNLISRKAAYRKPIIVISSYGWGPVAGKKMRTLLERVGFSITGLVEFKGSPTPSTISNVIKLVKSALS